MKWVWRALIALLLIVTGTVSGIWFWLHADLPEYESTVRIEGEPLDQRRGTLRYLTQRFTHPRLSRTSTM